MPAIGVDRSLLATGHAVERIGIDPHDAVLVIGMPAPGDRLRLAHVRLDLAGAVAQRLVGIAHQHLVARRHVCVDVDHPVALPHRSASVWRAFGARDSVDQYVLYPVQQLDRRAHRDIDVAAFDRIEHLLMTFPTRNRRM